MPGIIDLTRRVSRSTSPVSEISEIPTERYPTPPILPDLPRFIPRTLAAPISVQPLLRTKSSYRTRLILSLITASHTLPIETVFESTLCTMMLDSRPLQLDASSVVIAVQLLGFYAFPLLHGHVVNEAIIPSILLRATTSWNTCWSVNIVLRHCMKSSTIRTSQLPSVHFRVY